MKTILTVVLTLVLMAGWFGAIMTYEHLFHPGQEKRQQIGNIFFIIDCILIIVLWAWFFTTKKKHLY